MPVKGSQPIRPRVSQPAQLRSFNHLDEARSRYLQPVFTNLLALWEQQQDPDAGRGLAPAVQILVRLFTGMADDLSWRVEHTTLQDNVLIRRAVTLAVTTVALTVLWESSGAAPRMAGCSGAPRKPKVEQVVECVGAFFESSPRTPAGTPSGTRLSRRR